jgi:hypothetical protein
MAKLGEISLLTNCGKRIKPLTSLILKEFFYVFFDGFHIEDDAIK